MALSCQSWSTNMVVNGPLTKATCNWLTGQGEKNHSSEIGVSTAQTSYFCHGSAWDILGCVYKILRTKNHGFETRFYRRAFIRVFSRACFWLSRTVPLRSSFCAACPLAKDQTGRVLWRYLNRVWDRCCVYKIFKTVFLEKHGFELHLFVRFKIVFQNSV